MTHPLKAQNLNPLENTITDAQMQQAVKTLIAYAGDNPEREGLKDTPDRVVKGLKELYAGYKLNGIDYLHSHRTHQAGFEQSGELIYLKNIPFSSYCEHHILPIIGQVSIAYQAQHWKISSEAIIGFVEIYARRLQIQEKMNAQIASDLQDALQPLGCAVMIKSVHYCMAMRGIHKDNVNMITTHFKGSFTTDSKLQAELLKKFNA